MVNALTEDAHLDKLRGFAQDSGEGRWTVQAAVDHAVPLPVITAALFARFASRQDDSPAMKVVAALRNQFGGHAVTASAGSTEKGADAPGADVAGRERPHRQPAAGLGGDATRRPDARLLPVADRLPVLARARAGARAGPDGAGGGERAGQDQRRRGAGLRRHARARTGSAPTRRWCGPAPSARSCGPGSSAAGAAPWSRSSSTRAGPTGHGSTARRCRGPARCSGCCAPCCSRRRTWRSCGATRRSDAASWTTCWSCARPGSPGCAATTSGCSSSATPCSRRRSWPAAPAAATCAPSTSGTRTWPGPAPSCWPPGWPWSTALAPHVAKAYAEVSAGQGEPVLAYRSSLGEALPRRAATGTSSPPRCSPSSAGSAPQEVERGVSPGRAAPRRAGAHARARRDRRAAGQGLRLARGVLVGGAGAAAGELPAAARRRGRRATASRCSCSTTCSPSSTSAGATGWPRWSAAPSRCWSPPRCADDVPEALLGGRVRRRRRAGHPCPLTSRPTPRRRAGARAQRAGPGAGGAGPGQGARQGEGRGPTPRYAAAPARRAGASGDARDPVLFGAAIARLVDRARLGEHDQRRAGGRASGTRWSGPEIADHCRPASLRRRRAGAGRGVLGLGHPAAAARPQRWSGGSTAQVGPGVVTRVVVRGPAQPDWRRGPRRVQGRGPRDTYG